MGIDKIFLIGGYKPINILEKYSYQQADGVKLILGDNQSTVIIKGIHLSDLTINDFYSLDSGKEFKYGYNTNVNINFSTNISHSSNYIAGMSLLLILALFLFSISIKRHA